MIEKLELTMPIICGVDGPEMVEKLGAYYSSERNILHANSYVLKGDKIMSLTISNGPIGRITASDAFSYIEYMQQSEG